MDKIYKGIFKASEAWTKTSKNGCEIVGKFHFPNNDTIYSCMLDTSLLNKWKILQFEANAEIPVSVMGVLENEDYEYDFKVKIVNFDLKNKFTTTITSLVPDNKNDKKIKGRVAINELGEPAIRCHINIDLGTNAFSLPKKKSATEGVHAVVKYNAKEEWPFNTSQLIGGSKGRELESPRLIFPKTTYVPDGGFDEVIFQFGRLSIRSPFHGQLWKDFNVSLDTYRLRINIPQHSEFVFPIIYKLELWKDEKTRIDLNKSYIRTIFSKQLFVAIEADTKSEVPSTWFRPEGTVYEVSIQHNEMMLHGFRDFEPNTPVEFQLEDIWEKKQREVDDETQIFYNFKNRRIKHIQVNENRTLALDKKEFDGEVLFDWSPIGAEHDLDEDHWRRLVPSIQSQCWIIVGITGLGKIAVQVSPAMLKAYTFIPSGSRAKIKLRVAQRCGFDDIGECGYLEIWCAGIHVDIEKRAPSEPITRRLRIDSIEKTISSNKNEMWKLTFSDPKLKSTIVKEFVRPLTNFEALKYIDVTDKFCHVTAFQTNDTLHVKRIDLIEM